MTDPIKLSDSNDFTALASAISTTADDQHQAIANLVDAYKSKTWDKPDAALATLQKYTDHARENLPSANAANVIGTEESEDYFPVPATNGADVTDWESQNLAAIEKSKDPDIVARKDAIKRGVSDVATKATQLSNNNTESGIVDGSTRIVQGLFGGTLKTLSNFSDTAGTIRTRLDRNLKANSNDTFAGELEQGIGNVVGAVYAAPVFITAQIAGEGTEAYKKSRETGASVPRAATAAAIEGVNQGLNALLTKYISGASKFSGAIENSVGKAVPTVVKDAVSAALPNTDAVGSLVNKGIKVAVEGAENLIRGKVSHADEQFGSGVAPQKIALDAASVTPQDKRAFEIGSLLGVFSQALPKGKAPEAPAPKQGPDAVKVDDLSPPAATDVNDLSPPPEDTSKPPLPPEVASTNEDTPTLAEQAESGLIRQQFEHQIDPPQNHSVGEPAYGQPPEGSNFDTVEHPGGEVIGSNEGGEQLIASNDGTVTRVVDGEPKQGYTKASLISAEDAAKVAALQQTTGPDGSPVDITIDPTGQVVVSHPYLNPDLTMSDTPTDTPPVAIPLSDEGHVVMHDETPNVGRPGTDKRTTITRLPIDTSVGAASRTAESTVADKLRASTSLSPEIKHILSLDTEGMSALTYTPTTANELKLDSQNILNSYDNNIGAFAHDILAKAPETMTREESQAAFDSAKILQAKARLPENAPIRDELNTLASRLFKHDIANGSTAGQDLALRKRTAEEDAEAHISVARIDAENGAMLDASRETGVPLEDLRKIPENMAKLDEFQGVAEETDRQLEGKQQQLNEQLKTDDESVERELAAPESAAIQAEIDTTTTRAQQVDEAAATADKEVKAIEKEAESNHAEANKEVINEATAAEKENTQIEKDAEERKAKAAADVDTRIKEHEARIKELETANADLEAKAKERKETAKASVEKKIKADEERLNLPDNSSEIEKVNTELEVKAKERKAEAKSNVEKKIKSDAELLAKATEAKEKTRIAKQLATSKKLLEDLNAAPELDKKTVEKIHANKEKQKSTTAKEKSEIAKQIAESKKLLEDLNAAPDVDKKTNEKIAANKEKQEATKGKIADAQKLLEELNKAPALDEKSRRKIDANKERVSKLRDLIKKSKPEDTLSKSQVNKLKNNREARDKLTTEQERLQKELAKLKAKRPKVDPAVKAKKLAEKKAAREAQQKDINEKKAVNAEYKKKVAERKEKLSTLDKAVQRNLDKYREKLTPEVEQRIVDMFKAMKAATGDYRKKLRANIAETIFKVRGIQAPSRDLLQDYWRGNVLSGFSTLGKHATTIAVSTPAEALRRTIKNWGNPTEGFGYLKELVKQSLFSKNSYRVARDAFKGDIPFNRDLNTEDSNLGLGFRGADNSKSSQKEFSDRIDKATDNFFARAAGKTAFNAQQTFLGVVSAIDNVMTRANKLAMQSVDSSHADYRKYVADNYDKHLTQAKAEAVQLEKYGAAPDKGWAHRRADELLLESETAGVQEKVIKNTEKNLLKTKTSELGGVARANAWVGEVVGNLGISGRQSPDITRAPLSALDTVLYNIGFDPKPMREKLTGEQATAIAVKGLGEGRSITINGKEVDTGSMSTADLLGKISDAILFDNKSVNLSGKSIKPLKYIMGQFTKTAANIMDTHMEYLPGVGILDSLVSTKKSPAKINDQLARDRLMMNQVIGSALSLAAFGTMLPNLDKEPDSNFFIYGNMFDKRYRDLMASKGVLPNTFRIGDKTFSYEHIPGAGAIFAIIGGLSDAAMTKKLHPDAATPSVNTAGLMSLAFLHFASSGPALKNMGTLVDAMATQGSAGDAFTKSTQRIVENVASGFIPFSNASRELARLQYGDTSRPYDMQSRLVNTLPFTSLQNARPVLNMWGEQVRQSVIPGVNSVMNDSKPVFETNWMLRNGYSVSMPAAHTKLSKSELAQYGDALRSENPDTFEPFLDHDQQYNYVARVGPQMKQVVNEYAQAYPQGYDPNVQKAITSRIKAIKAREKALILAGQ